MASSCASAFLVTEFVEFSFSFIFALAILFLHQADKLLTVTLNLIHFIIREITPLLLNPAFQLFPLTFCNICIHVGLLQNNNKKVL